MKLIKSLLAIIIACGILYGFFVYRDAMAERRKAAREDLPSVLNGLAEQDPEFMEEVEAAVAQAEGQPLPETTEEATEPETAEPETTQQPETEEPEETGQAAATEERKPEEATEGNGLTDIAGMLTEEVSEWLNSLSPEERTDTLKKLGEIGRETGKTILESAQSLMEKMKENPDPSSWLDALADTLIPKNND